MPAAQQPAGIRRDSANRPNRPGAAALFGQGDDVTANLPGREWPYHSTPAPEVPTARHPASSRMPGA